MNARLAPLALVACGRIDFFDLPDARDAAVVPDASCGHTFCDDFERSDLVGPWDSMRTNNGALAITNGQLVATETTTMPTTAQVNLSKLVGMANSHVHFEADYVFDTGGDGEIDLVQLHWLTRPASCTAYGFFLVRDRQTNSVALQETYTACGGTGNITSTFPGIVSTGPSGMHHVTIDVTLGTTTTARVDTMIDAVPLSRTAMPYNVPASQISLDVGLDNVQINATTWSVRWDNVIVDLQ